jgi:hypothetical protein
MTLGEMRRLIADLPDDVQLRILKPGGAMTYRAKCVIVGYNGPWRPGLKARSVLVCQEQPDRHPVKRKARCPAPTEGLPVLKGPPEERIVSPPAIVPHRPATIPLEPFHSP